MFVTLFRLQISGEIGSSACLLLCSAQISVEIRSSACLLLCSTQISVEIRSSACLLLCSAPRTVYIGDQVSMRIFSLFSGQCTVCTFGTVYILQVMREPFGKFTLVINLSSSKLWKFKCTAHIPIASISVFQYFSSSSKKYNYMMGKLLGYQ